MPRDSSGNYTLPPTNPVVAGTVIDVNWANPTLDDIAVQLNGVVTRDGLLGPTAPIGFADGTAANPGIKFTSTPTTGFFTDAINSLSVSTGGVKRFTWANTVWTSLTPGVVDGGAGASIVSTLAVNAGTAASVGAGARIAMGATAQGITPSRGVYLESQIVNASNSYYFSIHVSPSAAAPTETLRVYPGALRLIDGAINLPSYGFINDGDLGFWRPGSNVIDVVGGGNTGFRLDTNVPAFYVGDVLGTSAYLRLSTIRVASFTPAAGSSNLQLESLPSDGTSAASVQVFRNTNTTGTVALTILKGNNTTTTEHTFYGTNAGVPGVGATISQNGTRTIIGHTADDTIGRVQIWGGTSARVLTIYDNGTSGTSPNTGVDGIFLDGGISTGITIGSPNNVTCQIRFGDPDNNAIGGFTYAHSSDVLSMAAGGTNSITITNNTVKFPSILTTASAANAFIDNGASNSILRVTSARQYKQNIRDLPPSYMDIVECLRPVLYNSRSEADDPTVDHIGLIAEEVDEVSPALVNYVTNEKGHSVPDGIAYDRLAVILLPVITDLLERVKKLELH